LETLARLAILEQAGARAADFPEGTECGFENALAKRHPDGGVATARLFHRIAAIADLVDSLATLVLDRTFRVAVLPIDHPNAAGKPSIHLQTLNPLKRRRQVWESSHLAEDGRRKIGPKS
jgi:EAL domain-containing protein (putative c-di-GMP-specific phosphodiesterase class I)